MANTTFDIWEKLCLKLPHLNPETEIYKEMHRALLQIS